ncbi:8dbd9899-1f38-44cc-a338-01f109d9fc6a [Thermothielavioides terrestris]|uniref:8dbd9899-1f38-44cc-a338-01f109d9fc6a n=1 Tax=Thermothielavioides terrestris TaxID=2587410 RepID=A0A3S4BNI4_9PEZI|nr:8dbd9899-1f38-44cc-a338-01f109d9fc6a [Thermothielavioides terrestris]
MAYKIENI